MRYSGTFRLAALMFAAAGVVLASACVRDDDTGVERLLTAPVSVGSGSGSAWTTLKDCSTIQDANHYALGHIVAINGNNFGPGTYDWSIEGNPGGSSGDPGTVVASGTLTVDAYGAASAVTGAIGGLQAPGNHQFCFLGYKIAADDWGEYKWHMGDKHDNYRVDGLVDLSKTANVGWTRAYEWTIAKTASPTSIDLFAGEAAPITYTIAMIRGTASNVYSVAGNILATNTSANLPALVNVVDCLQVEDGYAWINVPGVECLTVATSLAPGSSTLPYAFNNLSLDQAKRYRNRVAIDDVIIATAAVTFPGAPSAEVNGTVHVTDTFAGPWTFTGSGTTTYTREVSCPANHSGYGSHEVENTATITETSQFDEADIYYSCNGLTVTKTAATAFTKTWTWTVNKTVTPTAADVAPGQTLNVDYTVPFNATSAHSDFAVTGTIHIVNSNATRAATLLSVTDALAGPVAAVVDCPALSVPAAGTLDCTYAAAPPDASTRVNAASVVQQLYSFDVNGNPTPNGTDTFIGTATADFASATVTEIDECTAVSDTYTGSGIPATICVNGGLPRVFTYSRAYLFDPGICGPQTVPNTAAFNTSDRHIIGSSTASVTINVRCETGCTLTKGYWKTHSSFGPAPYDDNWASVGGAAATFAHGISFYTALMTPPAGGNVFYQLAHQFIAATLNVNNGASAPPAVSGAMTAAAAFFANTTYTPAYIGALKSNSAIRKQYLDLAGLLGSYNEGLIGPGHCSEDRLSVP